MEVTMFQFFTFPTTLFSDLIIARILFWKGLICRLQMLLIITSLKFKMLTFYHSVQTFHDPEWKSVWKHFGTRKNAGDQHLLLFPHCFQLIWDRVHHFTYDNFILFCCLQMLWIGTSLSFSHTVFNWSETEFIILDTIILYYVVVCKCFQLGPV